MECNIEDYDENLRTAIFKQDDEFGTEKSLALNTTNGYLRENSFSEHSNITRYKIDYDEKGRVIKREYAGYQNIDVSDQDMVHGKRYQYDDRGRVIEVQFIGLDGNVRGNKNGLAIKRYEWDDEDNSVSTSYFTVDNKPSYDGNNNISKLRFGHDEWGNQTQILFLDLDNNPIINSSDGTAGHLYKYNEKGLMIEDVNLDSSENPTYCSNGYVTQKYGYDSNGYFNEISFYDEDDQLIDISVEGMSFAKRIDINNEYGRGVDNRYYDKYDNPVEDENGVWRTTWQYDNFGNNILESYYDKDNNPTGYGGFQYSEAYTYDENNNVIELRNLDADGHLTLSSGGNAKISYEYNRSGNLIHVALYDKTEHLALNNRKYAQIDYGYDDLGNRVSTKYLDVDGNLIMSSDGHAVCIDTFDPKTNYLVKRAYYNTKNEIIESRHYKYDKNGNNIEYYVLDDKNQLKTGTCVQHGEFDSQSRMTNKYYTDLQGNRRNCPDTKYGQVRYEYDERGNTTRTSYWTTDSKPAANENGTHESIKSYDRMNRMLTWKDLDINGKPAKSKNNWAEVHYEYDQRGNTTDIFIFDGYGKKDIGTEKWHHKRTSFDNRNNILIIEFYDSNDNRVVSSEVGYSKQERSYNEKGLLTMIKEFDLDKLQFEIKYTYNDRDRYTEDSYYDGAGKLTDKKYGYAKSEIEYKEDGVTPIKRSYYDTNNKLVAHQTYNSDKNEWSDYIYANSGRSNYGGSNTGDWQQTWRDYAASCPQKLEDGITVRSVSVGSSYVSITVRLDNWSKYEMGSEETNSLKELRTNLTNYYRGYVPDYVSIYIYFEDKAGRSI